jgi:hypothetical protein
MVNREVPAYLSNLLPDTLSNLHHHFTRRSQNISAIRTRTSLYTGYYLPSSIKLWNEFHLEFRNITSPDIFKNRLKVIYKKRPSYYYIGSRLAQVLHARLRMDSSSLNVHLFLRNLVDNPNCTCGQTETTAHFLLQCRNYSVIRDTTINSLNLLVPITAKLLLYGSTDITDEHNTLIFTKVQTIHPRQQTICKCLVYWDRISSFTLFLFYFHVHSFFIYFCNLHCELFIIL